MSMTARMARLGLVAALVGALVAPTPTSPASYATSVYGLDAMIQRILDAQGPPIFNYLGWGNGDGAGNCTDAAGYDVTLQHEVFGFRQGRVGTHADPPYLQAQTIYGGFGAGSVPLAGDRICEIGLFNASLGGTMLAHHTFTAVVVGFYDYTGVTLTFKLM